ncbi:MAG: type II toxin-antitoxin system prevent-host-death family antitoxin [Deltaproteobacteria bacterium]|nr:type II toxin-antitoxin system prevent-host-death family antitoxin [Deltaproteobacteria bacterium]
MEAVGVYEAKTHLPRLLERVAQGESITITKHGKAVAVLSPVPTEQKMSVKEAIEGIKALRSRINARLSQKEIKQMIEKGRR